MDTIKIHDLYEHCNRIAETLEKCLEQAWANKRNQAPDIAAIAYFMQKVDLYRYEIPRMIKDFVDTLEPDAEDSVSNCTQLYREATPGEALDAWSDGEHVQALHTKGEDEWWRVPNSGCAVWDSPEYRFRILND